MTALILGVISDPKAAVEFRHLRWKAVREELVLFLDLLRLCCMPEHPWWTTNKAFRANGEEVYIELRDGAIIHYARKVKDLRD